MSQSHKLTIQYRRMRLLAFKNDWTRSSISKDVLCSFPQKWSTGCKYFTCSHSVYELCCSVRITHVIRYHSPITSVNHSASNFLSTILLIEMLRNTEWRSDSKKIPTENVPSLQVYWHPFICQFLIQLKCQIDVVSLFLNKNVRQCYVTSLTELRVSYCNDISFHQPKF